MLIFKVLLIVIKIFSKLHIIIDICKSNIKIYIVVIHGVEYEKFIKIQI